MSEEKKSNLTKISLPLIIIGVVMCFCVAIFGHTDSEEAKSIASSDVITQQRTQVKTYTFRNQKLLDDHFKKHGADTYCKSAEEYLQKANDVINSPYALTKKEAEDGDSVFYIEQTDEIVFLSTDGYIRTYFICSGKNYFDRQ